VSKSRLTRRGRRSGIRQTVRAATPPAQNGKPAPAGFPESWGGQQKAPDDAGACSSVGFPGMGYEVVPPGSGFTASRNPNASRKLKTVPSVGMRGAVKAW
jgi:hypothetical protein